MGLIKQALNTAGNAAKDLANSASGGIFGAVTGVANQALFQEYLVSGTMTGDILMKRAEQVKTNGMKNTKSDANVITNGSYIDIQVNQCAIIVENGKIVEACMEPGRFVYDTSVAPTLLVGKFGENIKAVALEMWNQAKMGGQRANTQRVYFINMGILDTPFNWGLGNVPFRHCSKISDNAPAIRINMMLRANGIAKLRIVDPIAFYSQKGAQLAGGDNDGMIKFADYQNTLFEPARSLIREAVASAVSQISNSAEISYTEILSPENADLFRKLANERIAASEIAKCGFEFGEFAVNGAFEPREQDMTRLMDMEEKLGTSAFMASDLNMANYDIQKTFARGFENAGQNGGVQGIMGMGMAMGGGMGSMGNIQAQPTQHMQQTQQAMQQTTPVVAAAVATPAANGWKCSCGATVSGNFCPNCGSKKPEAPAGWTCSCGHTNQGNFCANCGGKKPEAPKKIVCDKCGWTGDSNTKFCPNCGDPVNEADFK